MENCSPLPLSVEKLMAKAREICNIDIHDEELIEPLNVLHESLCNEGMMHAQGAQAMQNFLLRMLCNRLRMKRDFIIHPEIADQKVKAPIFLWGGMRTGSTKTQKLLAASDDFNWLPFWQSLNPCLYTGNKNESTQPRIDDATQFTQWLDSTAPNMKFIHEMKPFEPDEETFFLINSFKSACLMGIAKIPSFIHWLMAQDMTAQFEYLRDTLKYLQWQGLASESKRWVLKSPFYYGLEPALLKVFPDANMIMTHRHPAKTFPSTSSMLKNMHLPYSNAPLDYHALLTGMSYSMDQHLAVRKSNPELKILDINYQGITDSIETVIKKIYAFCNEPLTEESRQRIHQWNDNNPIHKKGVHKYTLEEFGITEQQLNQQYARYIGFLDTI